jgi:hypothetical protein
MNKIDINMYGSYPYYINLIIRPPTPTNANINKLDIIKKQLTFPPKIDVNKINLMSDLHYLSSLENMYHEFLNKNQHLLSLYNMIDELLDIRDALSIQVSKLKRKEGIDKLYSENKKYDKTNNNLDLNNNNINSYDNINNALYYQKYLPSQLCLSQHEIKIGYKLINNEPKEYKCGCQTIRYTKESNSNTNSNSCILKKELYCNHHSSLKRKEKILMTELKLIRKEIINMKRDTNSIDFDIQSCKMMQNEKNICKSKYPWKQ